MEDAGVLIVDDERAIREMVVYALTRAGFQVSEADSAALARARIAERRPSVVLIDWGLPDYSGLELARALKSDKDYRDLPVIMLTARATEDDKVTALESGVDDYITKPFSPKELIARIRAILRRVQYDETSEAIEIGGMRLDPSSHRVSSGNATVPLGPTEYRVLAFLMSHAKRAYSRRQLLEAIWGYSDGVSERTIDVHIRRLRVILERFDHAHLIQTVRGLGYRFSGRSG